MSAGIGGDVDVGLVVGGGTSVGLVVAAGTTGARVAVGLGVPVGCSVGPQAAANVRANATRSTETVEISLATILLSMSLHVPP